LTGHSGLEGDVPLRDAGEDCVVEGEGWRADFVAERIVDAECSLGESGGSEDVVPGLSTTTTLDTHMHFTELG
jgi:hypothetical protein